MIVSAANVTSPHVQRISIRNGFRADVSVPTKFSSHQIPIETNIEMGRMANIKATLFT